VSRSSSEWAEALISVLRQDQLLQARPRAERNSGGVMRKQPFILGSVGHWPLTLAFVFGLR
jgi:hypothetical protein